MLLAQAVKFKAAEKELVTARARRYKRLNMQVCPRPLLPAAVTYAEAATVPRCGKTKHAQIERRHTRHG